MKPFLVLETGDPVPSLRRHGGFGHWIRVAAGLSGRESRVVRVFEGEELPDSDSLRVHIHGLRAAVDKPFDKALIQTRHGIGYRIADPDAG